MDGSLLVGLGVRERLDRTRLAAEDAVEVGADCRREIKFSEGDEEDDEVPPPLAPAPPPLVEVPHSTA